ncbi:PREDICTED: radial spoke head 10 homolog B2-like isoform X1 [Calidris pugnax]|uniref:radial spoke head 10 homolog B2-like isoform X1 n=1 Tax=Calidris pugnax TaxID=198806 RepID=UPI00071D6780|nr:PREDICTED: radial spoke head 10 homolog B2-like isoform X1 [Calidris pugnax]XP_014806887.1 PREDICTED: radial spoke head 10 homolog B2-like isoform X1 [Calidris pugnax]XP_014806889.1 PREDICTED: radial spoke head 10 homolog B2-like isoform X1 [Calidris pugnax]
MAKDKKKEGKKTERSARSSIPTQNTTAGSSSTKLTDLQTLVNEGEETQANPVIPHKEPEKVEEPPVPDVPQYKEPLLTEVIVKSYEGEKVNGLYEGEGFAYFEGGNTYKGMFSDGLMHGHGTYTWADGVKYEGTFVKNVQMFNGCYTWNDGSVYEGSVKNGVRHGFGFFRSGTRPVSYIGYWCEGKRHGKGTIYYDQQRTSWYSGDWVNNIKEGWGMRCYKSGNIYEGQWEKNVRHGKGRMRWLTANQEYMGQWVYGVQHGYGTHIWFLKRMPASQYALRNEYIGDFVKGERHGRGKFIYASGAVYDGEWLCNKKHGKGKFVFKNGHVYEGEFVNDCIVEYPGFQVDAVDAEELSAICPGGNFGTENITVMNGSDNTSVLGSNIELDISSLLDLFPAEERHEEAKQVEFAVLRHVTELRRIYTFYSSLGCDHSLDNTFLMTKLQFWRFLKDCQFHQSNITLAEMDRILSGDKTPLEEIHCPHETLLFRTFLSYLVWLAFRIYYEEHKEKGPYLQKCFLEMMSRNVIPAACRIQGILFSEERYTVFAMSYVNKCWEIYRDFCRPSTRPPFEPTMNMRHFLWMLNDFKLLSKELTASRLVEILVKDGPLRDSSSANLEQELVFLEFVEALLDCALVYVTRDMIKEQVDGDYQKISSFRTENLSKGTTNTSLYPQYSLSQYTYSRSMIDTDITDDVSEAAELSACLGLSSSKIVISQDKIKKYEAWRSCEDRGHSRPEFLPDTVLSFHTIHGGIKEVPSLFVWDAKKEHTFSPAKELTDKPKEAKTEQDEEFSLWMHQVQIFFTAKFFPAYQHEKVLREKIKANRVRDVELAELRRIKDDELAKVIAEREAEEAKRQEAAAAEKPLDSRSGDFKEVEEPVVQEEAPTVAPPLVTKAPTGKKRRKK